jgi:hypothetical protein
VQQQPVSSTLHSTSLLPLLLLLLCVLLCAQAVLPIVFGALEENAANHWNPAVHGLTCNVRKMFMVRQAKGGPT